MGCCHKGRLVVTEIGLGKGTEKTPKLQGEGCILQGWVWPRHLSCLLSLVLFLRLPGGEASATKELTRRGQGTPLFGQELAR